MNKVTLNNWKKLFEYAKEIYSLAPWKYLWDVNLIGVQTNSSNLYFCSMMGHGGQCTGIAVYPGLEGLSDFRQLSFDSEIQSVHYVMGDQDCLTMYVGERSEVPEFQLEIMKKLNIRFKKGQYIYFNSFKKRYYPTHPDEEEVADLVDVYEGLVYAFHQDREWFNINWDEQNMLLVEHTEDSEEPWMMMEVPEPRWMERYPTILIDDEDLVNELLEKPYNNIELALDMDYLFVPIRDDDYERDINTLMCVAMDLKADLLLGVDLIDPKTDELQVAVKVLINCISQHGRPRRIYMRNPRLINGLWELLEALEIEVVEDALDEMNDVMNNFLQYMNGDLSM